MGDGRLEVLTLHREVDRQTGRLAARHAERLQCRMGCASCCVDNLTVWQVEAERIRREHPDLLRDGTPHPEGACAFLDPDTQACRIYDSRPYVCRTQGLPLRWFEDTPEGRWVEYRDICPLNVTDTPVEALAERDCWTIGPVEEQLAKLAEASAKPDAPRRVALRDLFG